MKIHEYYRSNDFLIKNLPLSLSVYFTIILVFGDKIFGVGGGQALTDSILWVSGITFATFSVGLAKRLLRQMKWQS